jgi:membrane protein implicated in regulation of membrane protease activity
VSGSGLFLVAVFFLLTIVGQTIAVWLGLLVERYVTANAGILTFAFCYFAVFWIAWRLAVRLTEPSTQDREHSKPGAVLLACATADELWAAPTLLV